MESSLVYRITAVRVRRVGELHLPQLCIECGIDLCEDQTANAEC
jgi:hypothetical protein